MSGTEYRPYFCSCSLRVGEMGMWADTEVRKPEVYSGAQRGMRLGAVCGVSGSERGGRPYSLILLPDPRLLGGKQTLKNIRLPGAMRWR